MVENENELQPERELTVKDLINALSEVLEPEMLEDLKEMDFEEALGYAFTYLLEQGEDPDEFLREKGILE